jgi:GNAT superfamily N-acetyltransferase
VSAHLAIDVEPVSLEAILGLREEYRREMNCQIVHDSWHSRGFTRSYLLRVRGEVVGHGSVGGAPRDARDILKEFFVRPPHRGDALPLFRRLVAVSGARSVEAQTNDALLLLMLHDCAIATSSGTILFADGATMTLGAPAPGVVVRRVGDGDRPRLFAHTVEPAGEWGVEADGEIVATGGLIFHYNPPYGDIYMEVAAPHRRKGFGSYLVQELKRVCHEMGCIPAARCNQANVGSRLALQRAGMFPCARIVRGELAG